MKYTLLKLASLALLPALAHAAPAPNIPKDFGVGVTKQQKSQNRIGLTLGRLQSQLDSVITEYKNNGLKGDDLDSLEKFSKMLKTLSESEVKDIIAKLEKAKQKKTDLKEASTPATEAFKGQKHVLGKLHEIYLEWQREQIYRELADRYRALAGTQNQNMRSAARLHKKTGSIKSRLTSENVQTDLRLQQLDQVAIEEEAAILQKRIEVLDKKESYYIEPRPRLALRKIKSELSPAMEMAKTSLNENLNLEAAAEAELQAKRAMEAIAKLLSPARDKEEILRQALADIGRISADQDKILENTKALDNEDGQELGFEQGDLVEQTDSVLQDVGDLVPEAASPLIVDDGAADVLDGGRGDDLLFVGKGDNAGGGAGTDTFYLLGGDLLDPAEITDYSEEDEDLVYVYDEGADAPEIAFVDNGDGTQTMTADGETVALIQSSLTLTADNVVLYERGSDDTALI